MLAQYANTVLRRYEELLDQSRSVTMRRVEYDVGALRDPRVLYPVAVLNEVVKNRLHPPFPSPAAIKLAIQTEEGPAAGLSAGNRTVAPTPPVVAQSS